MLRCQQLRRGGERWYRGGFISHYLVQVIYPPGLTRGIQIGLGLVVVLLAAVGYGGYLRRHGTAPGSADQSLITVLAGAPPAEVHASAGDA